MISTNTMKWLSMNAHRKQNIELDRLHKSICKLADTQAQAAGNTFKWLSMKADRKLGVHKKATDALSAEAGHVNTITITGKVGTGKSTLGGLLAGTKHFKTASAMDSVTTG